MDAKAQQQLDRGAQLTLQLIHACNQLAAGQQITADNCAKALLAASVNLGLQSAPRAQVCAWLRTVAAELEQGALTAPPAQVN